MVPKYSITLLEFLNIFIKTELFKPGAPRSCNFMENDIGYLVLSKDNELYLAFRLFEDRNLYGVIFFHEHDYLGSYLTFEKAFDLLSDNAKEHLIYHADVFEAPYF